ncbi:hypothetical protein NUW54_g7492 [Trametes sanguinea]|uniref:Uncharacterized protein n=1 Tax=Trametes sanguinea TaxID=158606 RepID=A0ACC1PKQ9_9APHY|nr:hypothetical protein NUW54_g7492 [Trametes sanguinea]
MSNTVKVGTDDFVRVPRLEVGGANWVLYKDRLLWAADAKGVLGHLDGTFPTVPLVRAHWLSGWPMGEGEEVMLEEGAAMRLRRGALTLRWRPDIPLSSKVVFGVSNGGSTARGTLVGRGSQAATIRPARTVRALTGRGEHSAARNPAQIALSLYATDRRRFVCTSPGRSPLYAATGRLYSRP